MIEDMITNLLSSVQENVAPVSEKTHMVSVVSSRSPSSTNMMIHLWPVMVEESSGEEDVNFNYVNHRVKWCTKSLQTDRHLYQNAIGCTFHIPANVTCAATY